MKLHIPLLSTECSLNRCSVSSLDYNMQTILSLSQVIWKGEKDIKDLF